MKTPSERASRQERNAKHGEERVHLCARAWPTERFRRRHKQRAVVCALIEKQEAQARRAIDYKNAFPVRGVSGLSRNYFRFAGKISCTTEDKNKLSNGL